MNYSDKIYKMFRKLITQRNLSSSSSTRRRMKRIAFTKIFKSNKPLNSCKLLIHLRWINRIKLCSIVWISCKDKSKFIQKIYKWYLSLQNSRLWKSKINWILWLMSTSIWIRYSIYYRSRNLIYKRN